MTWMIKNDQKWLKQPKMTKNNKKITQNNSRRPNQLKMIQNDSKWDVVQKWKNDSEWLRMTQNDSK